MTGPWAFVIFFGIPLALAVLVAALVYTADAMKRSRSSYRPGRPWLHDPVWLVSSEADVVPVRAGDAVDGRPAGGGRPQPGDALVVSDRSGTSSMDLAALEAPVPGPVLVRARARRMTRAAQQGVVTVVREDPGGARGTW